MNRKCTSDTYSKGTWIFWGLIVALLLLMTAGSTKVMAQELGNPDFPPASTPITEVSQVDAVTSTPRTVTFSYDRSGRLTSANYGDGVLLVYDYDPNGNLKQVTDRFGLYLPVILRQSN